MKLTKVITSICLIALIFSCTPREKICVISGEVIDRPQSKNLILVKNGEDIRSGESIKIPITDGKFHFELPFIYEEHYELIFDDEMQQNAMRPIDFFLNEGNVKMKLLKTDDFDKNVIDGGSTNKEFYRFRKEIEQEFLGRWEEIEKKYYALDNSDSLYSDTINAVYTKISEAKNEEERNELYKLRDKLEANGLEYSEAGKKINEDREAIQKETISKQLKYIEENRSILSYYMLIDNIKRYKQNVKLYNLSQLKALQEKFYKEFKQHSYAEYSKELLWNVENIKVGGKYYDFTLNDINGKEYKLSDLIKNNFAYIDIWAPWCGPCIQNSRSIKPIYEEFKDKSFVVVGVASKYKEIKNVKNILEKDKYPWITLIDEPEKNSRINQKYGIEHSGGGTYLLDRDGTILAINPSIKEVREILNEKF